MSAKDTASSRISAAPLSALLLAKGEHRVLLTKVLESHGFTVATAVHVEVARLLCARERFDLAVYDQDVNGALDLARESRSSKPRVAVGLLQPGKALQVEGLRVHFLLHKPLTSDLFAKTLKAAYGPIAADRRASFRHLVNIEASHCNMLDRGDLRSVEGVRVVNVSQTGLCLQALEMMPQGATVEVGFTIPESDMTVQLSGTVIWAHASGRAGVQFSQLDPAEQRKLEQWHESVLPNFDTP
jgi:PilZ domain-containing protein